MASFISLGTIQRQSTFAQSFVLGIGSLRCPWPTREQCLLGRWRDEAKNRNPDHRDVSLDRRHWGCGPAAESDQWSCLGRTDSCEEAGIELWGASVVHGGRHTGRHGENGEPDLERGWHHGCWKKKIFKCSVVGEPSSVCWTGSSVIVERRFKGMVGTQEGVTGE